MKDRRKDVATFHCLFDPVRSWMLLARQSALLSIYMFCTHSCRHRPTYQAFVMIYTHRNTPIHSGHAHDGKASRLQVQQETYVIALVVAWEQAHGRHCPVCDFLCALPSLLLTIIHRARRCLERFVHSYARTSICTVCLPYKIRELKDHRLPCRAMRCAR